MAGATRMADDERIELFIFPDGTAVEMIVFEHAGAPVAGQSAPRRLPERGAARHMRGAATAAGRRRGARSAPSAAVASSTPSTGTAATTPPGY